MWKVQPFRGGPSTFFNVSVEAGKETEADFCQLLFLWNNIISIPSGKQLGLKMVKNRISGT